MLRVREDDKKLWVEAGRKTIILNEIIYSEGCDCIIDTVFLTKRFESEEPWYSG